MFNKRPDGLSLLPWTRGKSLIWDATCVHRLAPSYSHIALLEGAAVAAAAEQRKAAKYEELMADYHFEAIAVETLGGLGAGTWRFIRKLGSMLQSVTGDPCEKAYLRQRLSLATQLGNAACISETFKDHL